MTDIKLTDKQKSAVTSTSLNTAVIAGPGSGKTRVLTERICYLVSELHVPKENILALTFTNKAAAEMKKRVVERLGKDYGNMNIMTFHKLGLQILRENGNLIGYSNGVEIADNSTRYNIVRELLNKYAIKDVKLSEAVQNISFYKNGVYVHDASILKIIEGYNESLFKQGVIDLEDLICKSVQLLTDNPLIRQFYQKLFPYILIDEYQDINEPQKVMIDLISSKTTNMFVVGDDDQCIYEWRGSTPQLLQDFINEKNPYIIRLEDNFRSNEEIVSLSGNFIKSNIKRIQKKLLPIKDKKETSDKQKIIYNRYPSAEREGFGIADIILDLQENKGYQSGDIAILVRGQKQIKAIREALLEKGIECCEHTTGDLGFTNFVKVLNAVNSMNNKNLMSAINFPNKVLGTVGYRKLCETHDWDNINYAVNFEQMCGLDEEFRNKEIFVNRYNLIKGLFNDKDRLSLQEIISILTNYYQNENYLINEEKITNIRLCEQVLEIAKKYSQECCETSSQCTLQGFIDYINYVLQDESETGIDTEKVNIMTCHRAKGLEFPVVFIPGVQVGVFPNDYFVRSEADLEQERRLFYVTMTRAIDYLYISCYDNPLYIPPNNIIKCSFIAELGNLGK